MFQVCAFIVAKLKIWNKWRHSESTLSCEEFGISVDEIGETNLNYYINSLTIEIYFLCIKFFKWTFSSNFFKIFDGSWLSNGKYRFEHPIDLANACAKRNNNICKQHKYYLTSGCCKKVK